MPGRQGGESDGDDPTTGFERSGMPAPPLGHAGVARGVGYTPRRRVGCTRAYYHDYADNDVYGILKERLFDWRWRVPERPVEAAPYSRMADLNDPNHVPIVPDEVAARRFQVSSTVSVRVSRLEEARHDADRRPELAALRSARIRRQGPARARIRSCGSAMINSRDYQFAYENVYLSALSLTLARFQFMIQGYSNWEHFYSTADGRRRGLGPARTGGTTIRHVSARPAARPRERRPRRRDRGRRRRRTPRPRPPTSTISSQLAAANGFILELMSGGQLLVNLANSIVFEYSNKGVQMVIAQPDGQLRPAALAPGPGRGSSPRRSRSRSAAFSTRSGRSPSSAASSTSSLVTGPAARCYSSSTGYLAAALSSFSRFATLENNLKSYQAEPRHLEAELPRHSNGARTSTRSPCSIRQTQASLLSAQAGFRSSLDCSRSISGCRRRSRCGSTIRPSISSSSTTSGWTRCAPAPRRCSSGSCKVMSFPDRRAGRRRLASSSRCTTSSRRFTTRSSASCSDGRRSSTATQKQGFEGPEAAHNKEIFDGKTRLSQQAQSRRSTRPTKTSIDDQDKLATFLAKLDATPLPRKRPRRSATWSARSSAPGFPTVSVAQTQIRVFLIELPAGRPDGQPGDPDRPGQPARSSELPGHRDRRLAQRRGRRQPAPGLLEFRLQRQLQRVAQPQRAVPLRRRQQHPDLRPAVRGADQPPGRAESVSRRPDPVPAGPPCLHAEPRQVVQQIRLDMRNLVLQQRTFEINREQIIIGRDASSSQAEYDVRTCRSTSTQP